MGNFQNILYSRLIISLIFLSGCNFSDSQHNCLDYSNNSNCANFKLVSELDFISEITEDLNSRYKYSCVVFGNRDISNAFSVRHNSATDKNVQWSIGLKPFKRLEKEFDLSLRDIADSDECIKVVFAVKKKLPWDRKRLKILEYKPQIQPSTPCDSITRIIVNHTYKQFDELKKDKSTKDIVSLGNLFNQALKNKIDEYVDNLTSVKKEELQNCIVEQRFGVLDIFEENGKAGFKSGKYALSYGQKQYLNAVSSGVTAAIKEFKTSDETFFEIKVTGFADVNKVKGEIPISIDSFGFEHDLKVLPLIYNDNNYCNGNSLVYGQKARFLDLGKKYSGLPELKEIRKNSNCELTAVRAYVAAKFLELTTSGLYDNISYRYAAGGVLGNSTSNATSRKIQLTINLKGAVELNQ